MGFILLAHLRSMQSSVRMKNARTAQHKGTARKAYIHPDGGRALEKERLVQIKIFNIEEEEL